MGTHAKSTSFYTFRLPGFSCNAPPIEDFFLVTSINHLHTGTTFGEWELVCTYKMESRAGTAFKPTKTNSNGRLCS